MPSPCPHIPLRSLPPCGGGLGRGVNRAHQTRGLPPSPPLPHKGGESRPHMRRMCPSQPRSLTSSVRRVELDRFGDLALPAVPIGEKFRLVIVEFLARLGREFEIRTLHDGIDRTRL